MTAANSYFQAANDEFLPAAIPIYDKELRGISTVVFDVRFSKAEKMAFSKDRCDRATAAIFACHAAYGTVTNVIPMA